MNINIVVLDKNLPEIKYETNGSSGIDLRACSIISHFKMFNKEETIQNFNEQNYIVLNPLNRITLGTGLKFEIPEGFEAQIRPRSGLTSKKGLIAQMGTIDSDYRGEIGVVLINYSNEPFELSYLDRVAQIVFQKIKKATFNIVTELEATDRNEGGFGSTGIK